MPNSSRIKAKTAGEELYLVHLQRRQGSSDLEEGGEDEDDHEDTMLPWKRPRGHSVGEELWEIHVKRSRGMDNNDDNNDDTECLPPKEVEREEQIEADEEDFKTTPKHQSAATAVDTSCPYNLRRPRRSYTPKTP